MRRSDSCSTRKKLPNVTYKSTARFSLYDPKTKAKKGEVAAGVMITVKGTSKNV